MVPRRPLIPVLTSSRSASVPHRHPKKERGKKAACMEDKEKANNQQRNPEKEKNKVTRTGKNNAGKRSTSRRARRTDCIDIKISKGVRMGNPTARKVTVRKPTEDKAGTIGNNRQESGARWELSSSGTALGKRRQEC